MKTDRKNPNKKGDWDKEHFYYSCSDGQHESFWATIVQSKEWYAWEREQRKRMSRKNMEGCFDYDESRECNWISPNHWNEFIKFIIHEYKK